MSGLPRNQSAAACSGATLLVAVWLALQPAASVAAGPHLLRKHQASSARPAAAITAVPTHVDYYGGRVISQVDVVQVLWGTGSYIPEVSGTASPSIATFYQAITASPYFDWLNEYDTLGITASAGPGLGSATSGQTIGRGTFQRQVTITPSVTATRLTDADISTELAAQIRENNLPAPTVDVAGNINTYYAVFFPSGVSIDDGTGSLSCVAYCAYHSTARAGTLELYYGIHPDMQTGSGCDTGCGPGTTFEITTATAAHELAEAVTDPETGLAPNNAPPLGWYDAASDPGSPGNDYGEIGDICSAYNDPLVGADGVTYTVQEEFSNLLQSCISAWPATQPPLLRLQASATSVRAGNAFSLSWAATPAGSACTASGGEAGDGWGGVLAVNGAAAVVEAVPGEYTYDLSCNGAGLSAQAQVTADVYGTATYDEASRHVSLPLVAIGNGHFRNMVVAIGGVTTPPSGTAPTAVVVAYDPATAILTVPEVTIGASHFYNAAATVTGLVSAGGATGIDSYDAGLKQLTIPAVLAYGKVYTNVVIKVAGIVSVQGGMPADTRDTFNAGLNQLTIPAVLAYGRVYTNVVITAGAIVSVN